MTVGEILWSPSPERAEASRMASYVRFLETEYGLRFDDYDALWQWSVSELEAFWASIWTYFEVETKTPYSRVLAERVMPGAQWFPGASVNYAAQILRHAQTHPDKTAIVSRSETFPPVTLNWNQLQSRVAQVAAHLRGMGVAPGDRVVAILSNTDTSIIACLATLSIGAVWSLCAPDMGNAAIIDRFKQISPKVLIAQDGYVHAGTPVDRRALIGDVRQALPSLEALVWVPALHQPEPGSIDWNDLVHGDAPLDIAFVPFDHPLWVVYSSGTTGDPKPIVHGHGGILLESCKQSLHQDIGPDSRFSWLTSSGWIMWNLQLGVLGQGASVAQFDGAPNHPDLLALWRFVAEQRLTYFGAGAAFFETCLKAGISPRSDCDLSALTAIGSTGSPLSSDGYDWIYRAVSDDVWLAPISGGTDIGGAFVIGNPMLPVRAGEMQCRALGNATYAYDPDGAPLVGQVGELVCTEPLPAMPLYFWGDTDGSRYKASYFETYPGVWTHGDWIEITKTGGAVIYGRSDATINRKGLRLGTSEIYRAVEGMDEIRDSLVVDLEFLGRDSFMPLFVVLTEGHRLDDALKDRINRAIRAEVSPRFIPNEIVQIEDVPRTLSGKKLEIPVKKLLLGDAPGSVVNRDSMSNPDSFDFFIQYAATRG